MKYKRQCPQCDNTIIYKTKKYYQKAIKDNTLCRICACKISNKSSKESQFIRFCPQCNKKLTYTTKKDYNRAVNRNTLCMSCTNKKNWKNKEYRDKITNANSKQFIRNCPLCNREIIYKTKKSLKRGTNNKSLCKSCTIKEKWQDEEYKAKQIKRIKEKWQDEKYKEKIKCIDCKRIKEKWQDEKYKEKQIKSQSKKWNNEEYREKMTTQSKEIWNNIEYKENQTKKQKEKWQDSEYRIKMKKMFQSKNHKEKFKKLWQDSEYREKQAQIRADQPKVSNIQEILYSILDNLGVKYYREYNNKPNDKECRKGWYNFDCVMPRQGKSTLLIECQGDYWHSLPNVIRSDQSKSSYIINNFPDHEIKYLQEHEFHCKDKIVELIKYWTGQYKYDIVDYNFNELIIKRAKACDYRLLLEKYHYLNNAGRGGIAYGAYLNNELISVVVFSPSIRQNISIGKKFLELSRFCIHPKYQKKNLGSWFISRSIKLLKENKPEIEAIVSYTDTTFNHDGALYKSLNFVQDKIVKPDYWYVDNDGYVMHKKTLYNHAKKMKMKEREFAELHDYCKVFGKEKIRFVLELK